MNKHQIVKAHWRNKKTGEVILITQKGMIPQTFNYNKDGKLGFIGKSELKANWERIEE